MTRWLLLPLLALLLNACSDDSEEAKRPRANFEAQSSTSWFQEERAEARSASPFGYTTRAPWTPPTNYVLYSDIYGANGMFKEQKTLMHKSIDAFLTRDVNFTDDNKNYVEGNFFYRVSTEKWSLSLDELKAGDYFLYGFIPQEVASSASIVGNTNYSDGAVLTISGLKTVTHSDVCVIVGAIDGTSNTATSVHTSKDLTTGQFAVHANAASKTNDTPGSNYIYLLFDHLYTALRFCFTLDNDYSTLRTIKLTKLELRALRNKSETAKAQYDAIITLKATNDGSTPIQSVAFSPVASSANSPFEALYEGDEVEIEHGVDNEGKTKYTDFMGCFVPGETTYFTLRSTYNVYDKKGNLVREGCVAENTFDIIEMFNLQQYTLNRGHMYSLYITIKPTYLYVLSEPDLDNPTLTLN